LSLTYQIKKAKTNHKPLTSLLTINCWNSNHFQKCCWFTLQQAEGRLYCSSHFIRALQMLFCWILV